MKEEDKKVACIEYVNIINNIPRAFSLICFDVAANIPTRWYEVCGKETRCLALKCVRNAA